MTTEPTQPIRIDFKNIQESFGKHLKIEDNFKILISGKFGSGKTTFLNEFFDGHAEYEVMKLYPVNYSIALNQDIFELIKFDILFELLGKEGISFNKEEFDKWLTTQVFIKDHAYDILKPFLELSSKVGKNITSIVDPLIKLYKSYSQNHKKVQIDEERDVLKFLKSFKGVKGGIYEEDHLTNIITGAINDLPKQKILVIDDLDRIDPEHIFRILNVFSAHMDSYSNDNKFNFNKIILVADVDNLRKIYNARYGSDVDFSGYIDKFYSKELYRFDSSLYLKSYIERFIYSVNFDENAKSMLGITRSNSISTLLYLSMHELVLRRVVSLRKLKLMESSNFAVDQMEFTIGDTYINIRFYPAIWLVLFLMRVVDSSKNLIEFLENLSTNSNLIEENRSYNAFLIPALNIASHKRASSSDKYILHFQSKTIEYTLKHNFNDHYEATDIDDQNISPLELLIALIRRLESYKMIS